MTHLYSNDYSSLKNFIAHEPQGDKWLLRYYNKQLQPILFSQTKWHERVLAWLGFGPLNLKNVVGQIQKIESEQGKNVFEKAFYKKLITRCTNYNIKSCFSRIDEAVIKKFEIEQNRNTTKTSVEEQILTIETNAVDVKKKVPKPFLEVSLLDRTLTQEISTQDRTNDVLIIQSKPKATELAEIAAIPAKVPDNVINAEDLNKLAGTDIESKESNGIDISNVEKKAEILPVSTSLNQSSITEPPVALVNSSKKLTEYVNTAEISKLEEKTDVYKFTSLGMGKHKKVYSIKNSVLTAKNSDLLNEGPVQMVVKVPGSNLIGLYRNEYISYKISKIINLRVVPKVILIHHKWEKTKSLEKNYPYLKESLEKEWGKDKFLILQQYIPFFAYSNKEIDIESAHRALFFNMIMGRVDSKSDNSMFDKNNRVWEVDNDFMCGKWTAIEGHWLRKTNTWNIEISEKILSDILDLNPDLSTLKIWKDEEISQEAKKKITNQICNNLQLIKTGIQLLKDRNQIISFKSLFESMSASQPENSP